MKYSCELSEQISGGFRKSANWKKHEAAYLFLIGILRELRGNNLAAVLLAE